MQETTETAPSLAWNHPRWVNVAAVVFLLLWALWWIFSFLQPIPKLLLPHNPPSALWRYEFLGVDFIHNNAGVRTWHDGINPYLHLQGDPIYPIYVCTPPVLPLFSWTLLLPMRGTILSHEQNNLSHVIPYPFLAILLWFIASVAMIVVATALVQNVRRRLQLAPISLPVLLGVTLFSYPVLFELERGNFNVLVLLFIALGSIPWVVREKPSRWDEIATGICFGMAAAVKVFPLILLPGLLVLRKFTAAAAMLASLLLLWFAMFDLAGAWSRIAAAIGREQSDVIPVPMHSLSIIWRHVWGDSPLVHISPTLGVLLVIAAPAGVVSWFVSRSRRQNRLMYPYALWLGALGTCAMIISVDYNLLLLVTATIALWNKRDPLWLQLLLIPWLLVWQPLQLGPDSIHNQQWFAIVLLIMKLWGMGAVGLLLIYRSRQLAALNPSAGTSRTH